MTAPRDLSELAAAMVRVHDRTQPAVWSPAADLAPALEALASRENVDPSEVRSVFAAVGELAAVCRRQAVRLLSAEVVSSDLPVVPRMPAALRPDRPWGPPEEDVLRLSLALACGPAGEWPDSVPDEAVLRRAARALGGAVAWRSHALALVLARLQLRRAEVVAGQDAARLIRRAGWALEASGRGLSPEDLLAVATAKDDPWIRLDVDLVDRAGLADAPEEPFGGHDWPAWRRQSEGVLRLGGRVTAARCHRKTVFVDLCEGGERAQVVIPRDPWPAAAQMRAGDLLVVEGRCTTTERGDRALQPTRVVFHAPNRLRQRVGIGVPDVAAVTSLLGSTRPFFTRHGFHEALTPLLSDDCLGGRSRPYRTWEAARRTTQYLRVTSELAMLELIASGVRRCYQIGPSFRNEGLHGEAQKEYLMLEAYGCDLSLDDMLGVTLAYLTMATGRSPDTVRRRMFDEAFFEASGVSIHNSDGVRRLADAHLAGAASAHGELTTVVRRLWDAVLSRRLTGITAVSAIPGPASPLVAGEGTQARRTWLYVDGVEVAEVAQNERDVDAVRRRLREQFAQDRYAVSRDYRSFLGTLAGGLPPVVGVGIGFMRLARIHQAAGAAADLDS